jgi:hypothetical protein
VVADKVKLSDIRAQFPMYADVPDDQLLIGLRKKFYADIPSAQFYSRIDFDTQKLDPTEGMSGLQKFAAGVGGGMTNLAQGVGQALGMTSREDVAEKRRLDAPLNATGAGMTGNVVGNVATMLPAAFIPGVNTMAGAAALGGATGALAPSVSTEETLKNTAFGGATGPLALLLGRSAAAAYKGGKALIEPFTEGGRSAIAGRTLDRFGVGAADVTGLSGAPTVTGARQTLAEQITNPTAAAGAARLQDSLRSLDPQIAGQFAAREVENNAARVGTLQRLAGQGGAREMAAAERAGTSSPIYQDAFNVDIGSRLTPELDRQMKTLLRSPAIKEAAQTARTNAANAGQNVGSANGSGSVEGLHNIKLALDDAIAAAKGGNGTAAQNVKAGGLKDAQKRLVSFIEEVSPEYKTARTVHAQMSKPINAMDTAAELLKRGTSATGDLAGTPRLMPDALMRSARDEAALMKTATGRPLGDSLDNLFGPEDLGALRGVLGEADRGAAVARAANGPGSATAQRLASQNVLRQLFGPTGLPQSWAESTLLNTAARPLQFAYNGVAEPRIQQELATLLLDPSKARAAIEAAKKTGKGAELAAAIERLLPGQATGGLLSYRQQQ